MRVSRLCNGTVCIMKSKLTRTSTARPPSFIEVRVPATSANLGPGFDCLGLALKLYNTVQVRPSDVDKVEFRGIRAEYLKDLSKNLFVRIFNETYQKLTNQKPDAQKQHFKFTFLSNIPLTRGLGSSSATIIGALAVAHKAARVRIDKDEILSLALPYESHCDNIAPACLGGFVSGIVQDGRVQYVKQDLPNYIKAVVVIPDKMMNTKQNRKLLPSQYSTADCVFNVSRASFLTACFLKGDFKSLAKASQDKMHQDVRMGTYSALLEVQKLALKHGALMSTLSGSGSTMFQLVFEHDARRLARVLRQNFASFQVKILDFDNEGLHFT